MWSARKVFNKRAQGEVFEQLALSYLKQQGLTFISQNVNFKGGEIDLIMSDDTRLVFVEVRYRKNRQFGGAAASVGTQKQQRLVKAAQLYLQKHYGNSPPSCRFDVVAIEGDEPDYQINWLKNAIS
ncbi:MAG: YraN family protein [Gammaproteobacteria bacterium]|nr:YraN family protein [Gammaproteobacteria bacterium]